MRVNFTARHSKKTSQRLKDYAQEEVKRLEKIFQGIVDCDIVLDYQKETKIAEINVGVHGTQLTAVEKSDDIYKSIDQAVAKLERQLKKYKQKNFQQFDKTETIKTELTQ
ncbi:ribosome-associated translation inhibitor RaiA [candidate division KSB1 bacterium]|nr:ribosome-associated translation inhibitor RaiA [candidate division KSB1 bacterium]